VSPNKIGKRKKRMSKLRNIGENEDPESGSAQFEFTHVAVLESADEAGQGVRAGRYGGSAPRGQAFARFAKILGIGYGTEASVAQRSKWKRHLKGILNYRADPLSLHTRDGDKNVFAAQSESDESQSLIAALCFLG
jgi:hypothetical protein